MYSVSGLRYYDRTPLPIDEEYAADAVAPHATTDRITYTVPHERQMLLTNLYIEIMRVAASPDKERVEAWAVVRGKLFRRIRIFDETTIGKVARTEFGGAVLLNEGESIIVRTADASAGGTIDYSIGMHGTEFDALETIDREIIVEPPKPDVQEPEVVKDPRM